MHAKLSLGGRRLRQDLDVEVSRDAKAYLPTGIVMKFNLVLGSFNQRLAVDVSRNRLSSRRGDQANPHADSSATVDDTLTP